MIEAIITGDKAVVARFGRTKQSARDAILRAVKSLAIQLQTYVKSRKLSGASPAARAKGAATGAGKYAGQALGVVTGRLKRSITHKVTETSGGVEGIVGTNVSYGRVHEYGFSGTVTVREHLRRSRSGSHSVSAHSRAVNLPERSFLRSSLRENRALIESTLRKAVEVAANE